MIIGVLRSDLKIILFSMIHNFFRTTSLLATVIILFVSCSKKNDPLNTPQPHDPEKAELASIDRFSATAGHLQIRNSTNGLPAANAAIDFDKGPFITKGIGPSGQTVLYYNFDTHPVAPAPIYVFFKNGQTDQVAYQLNVIYVTFNINPGLANGGPDSGFKREAGSDKTHNVVATLPADAGYSPLWKVVVYDNGNFNVVNNLSTAMTATILVPDAGNVNCPIV